MAVNLSALAGAGQQFFDNSGVILSGGKLYSYAAGTTTPQATYTSASGSTAHTNPIVLNSAGRVATGEIWLTAGSNYKFALYTSTDVLITTWDNITGINGTGITSNASNVTYDPAGTGAVATTVQTKLREVVSVTDFGASTASSDNAAAFNLFFASFVSGGNYVIPAGSFNVRSALTISSVSNWTLTMYGTIVPVTTTSPGTWEVASPTGVVNISGCTDFTVIPRIAQSSVASFGNGNVIYLTNCQRWTIRDGNINVACDVTVIGGKGAIRIGADCSSFKIVNNYLKAWYGVFAGGSVADTWNNIKDGLVSGNECVGQGIGTDGGIGISFDSPNSALSGIQVIGNNIHNYGNLAGASMGIAFANISNSQIIGNYCTLVREGIHIEYGSSNVAVRSNKVYDPYKFGITSVVTLGSPSMYEVDISENDILWEDVVPDGTQVGIAMSGASTTLFKDASTCNNNKISNRAGANTTAYGILGIFTQQCDVSRNTILGYHTQGIFLTNASSGYGMARCDQNTLYGTFTDGISINPNGKGVQSAIGNNIVGAANPLIYTVEYPFFGHVYQNPTNYNLPAASGSLVNFTTATILAGTVAQHRQIVITVVGTVTTAARAVNFLLSVGGTTIYTTGDTTWGATGGFQFTITMDCRNVLAGVWSQKSTVVGNWNAVAVSSGNISSALNFQTTDQVVAVQGKTTAIGATTDMSLLGFSIQFVD